jgi:hypothetical protein
VTQNADRAKAPAKKENEVLNLEKTLNERCEAMSKGTEDI